MPQPAAQYPPNIDAGLSGKPDIARVIISGPGPGITFKGLFISVIPGTDPVGNTIAGASRAQNAFSRPTAAQSESMLHMHIVTLPALGSEKHPAPWVVPMYRAGDPGRRPGGVWRLAPAGAGRASRTQAFGG